MADAPAAKTDSGEVLIRTHLKETESANPHSLLKGNREIDFYTNQRKTSTILNLRRRRRSSSRLHLRNHSHEKSFPLPPARWLPLKEPKEAYH
ncbi:hypothetical protein GW17_00006908 [Ensete ventricosum]|nr:hypothetical protein GW17_00006908 [Ensete ventricosum]